MSRAWNLASGLTRAARHAAFPFRRLPVLETGGRQIPESGALARLVADWTGLVPADPVEAALVHAVRDAANDLEEVEPIYNVRATCACAAPAQRTGLTHAWPRRRRASRRRRAAHGRACARTPAL